MNNDEEVPYRSPFNLSQVTEDTKFSKDEEEESTLRRVFKLLDSAMADLDKWHAFDIAESELKIKQQIKAHAIAAAIIAPCLEEVRQALATVDEKFRRRNQK
jgi:hypothetical protein